MTPPAGPHAMWAVIVGGAVVLSLACHLLKPSTHRSTDADVTPGQRRARSTPDGGNTDRLLAAQAKRARRRARNQQIAGRGGIHRPDTQVRTQQSSWWRRTARRR